jgi:hypothetical protein
MSTLIGTMVTCTVMVTSWHKFLKQPVRLKAENIRCLVVDDRLERVGYPGYWRTPIIIDCSKAIKFMDPIRKSGIYLLFKEDKDCEY